MPSELKLHINGEEKTVSSETGRSLLEVLREDLKLTGTKYGCGEGACGACTVLIDGKPTFSCTTMASEASGKKVATIEGLADGRETPSRAAGVLRCAGVPVRLLHARHDHGDRRAAGEIAEAERGGDRTGAQRPPVPVLRLHEHRRGRALARRRN